MVLALVFFIGLFCVYYKTLRKGWTSDYDYFRQIDKGKCGHDCKRLHCDLYGIFIPGQQVFSQHCGGKDGGSDSWGTERANEEAARVLY